MNLPYRAVIGPSLTEKPPKAMDQIQGAGWVSFPLPMTAVSKHPGTMGE
jgi:hypothetical protein